jgi:hypothetical protein
VLGTEREREREMNKVRWPAHARTHAHTHPPTHTHTHTHIHTHLQSRRLQALAEQALSAPGRPTGKIREQQKKVNCCASTP